MAGALTPFSVISKPGIKRDGTQFEGEYYTDGQWVRFQRGLPRKIWGYRQATPSLSGIVRGLFDSKLNNTLTIHSGSASSLERVQINADTGVPIGGITDRTPVGFVSDPQNQWTFSSIWNAAVGAENVALLAHAAPNANDIADDTNTPIYFGDINDAALPTPITGTDADVSGGVAVFGPYTFRFGNAGFVGWSDINQPDVITGGDSGTARITADKIVAGKPLRGGGAQAPSGLLWSLNSLIRVSYVGGAAIFSFDTISASTSILSKGSVIEYDGIFYWIGFGRFFVFNGVVQELPNPLNFNWFFENLNYTYANKIFGFVNSYWGEIWWCYPRGTATECTHALVYSVREGTWFDTELPNGGRSAGTNNTLSRYPYLTGTAEQGPGKYQLWQHEYGVNEVVGTAENAIYSSITTADITMPAGMMGQVPQLDQWLRNLRIEMDFVQSGTIQVSALSRPYAMAPVRQADFVPFSPANFDPQQPSSYVVWAKNQGRIYRLQFVSNERDGDYQAGQTLMLFEGGDKRQ